MMLPDKKLATATRGQTRPLVLALWATVAIVALLAAGAVFIRTAPVPEEPQQATVFPVARALPDFSLIDQDGNRFDRRSLAGQWDLMFFGFTHCPDVCPLTLQKLALARRQLQRLRRDRDLPRIVFVSVDPQRDSPEVAGNYASAFGADVIAVVGEIDELNVLTDALGIFHARPENAAGEYDVEHSASIVVVNPDGGYEALFSAPHDVTVLASDMQLIMGAPR